MCVIFFFFKQKTAYEMRISDWSSDVCSSDLHAWSEKAKKMMLDKQMKKATKAKEAKDPQADYEACFYRTPTGDYGFPTIGLKAAMVAACRFVDMKMTEARGARSKEHTSELQSLISTTYAVFCMTKQKTK